MSSVAISDVPLSGTTPEVCRATIVDALFPGQDIELADSSGRSGARSFLLKRGGEAVALCKIEGESVLSSHPNTPKRTAAAREALRTQGLAPKLLLQGPDFHVEAAAGGSVMKDFFHFKDDLPPAQLAQLLARFHACPTGWFAPLRELFLARDPELGKLLAGAPPHSTCWHLPFSGLDTGKVVMGMGNIPDETTQEVMRLLVATGAYAKVMLCEAFYPQSAAGRRLVTIHGDFKPDNVLMAEGSGELTAIDYDLVCVGPCVHEFGFMLMMWFGAAKTTVEFRKDFVRAYLEASGLGAGDSEVQAFLLDAELNTVVTFPGLLAHIYNAEVPLLRGTQHPTAEAGHVAGSAEDKPTGVELVDLLAEAVTKVRGDAELAQRCVADGLVPTLFALEGLGSEPLFGWLKHMQTSKMLRLFGIAPA